MVHDQKKLSSNVTTRRATRATVDLSQVDIQDLVAFLLQHRELARTPPGGASPSIAVQPTSSEGLAPAPVGQEEPPSLPDPVASAGADLASSALVPAAVAPPVVPASVSAPPEAAPVGGNERPSVPDDPVSPESVSSSFPFVGASTRANFQRRALHYFSMTVVTRIIEHLFSNVILYVFFCLQSTVIILK